MKLYIVTISMGQWSDHHEDLSAVFDNKELAEKYCHQIKEYYELPLSELSFPDEDYYEDGKLTEEQEAEHTTWFWRKNEKEDFNCTQITEMQINFPDQKYLQP